MHYHREIVWNRYVQCELVSRWQWDFISSRYSCRCIDVFLYRRHFQRLRRNWVQLANQKSVQSIFLRTTKKLIKKVIQIKKIKFNFKHNVYMIFKNNASKYKLFRERSHFSYEYLGHKFTQNTDSDYSEFSMLFTRRIDFKCRKKSQFIYEVELFLKFIKLFVRNDSNECMHHFFCKFSY